MRKYADYEYRIDGHTLRVQKGELNNWFWWIFWADGSFESSNEIGEWYDLKRDAKEAGMEEIEMNGHKHIKGA